MNINTRIEHTLLSTGALNKDIDRLCKEAISNDFRGVCVPPSLVKRARQGLAETDKKVITVIDFPFGYSHTFSKTEAIKKAADQGADGVDVVINYNNAINGVWHLVKDDIETVVHKAKMRDLEVKLIIELGAYPSKTLQQIVDLCKMAAPDYVKTNTGILDHVVTPDQLRLLVRMLNEEIPVKASGGIRSEKQAQELIDIGAELIGASSAAKW
ncbi:MAG: deoxyribose-phosphate aldolase [Saprospiraceae bacterium]|nr:deoxyribose-phosphate aldolase [Saprospiraceae bacterium]